MKPDVKDFAVVAAAFAALLVAYLKGLDGSGTALVGACGMLIAWFTQSPGGRPPGLGAVVTPDPDAPIQIVNVDASGATS